MTSIAGWQERARQFKAETYALYLAYRDPRTPWHARLLAAIVVGYALSPIDLIPDFVPALGYLDDLLLVPLGVALALRLIPPQVMVDARRQAQEEMAAGKPANWAAAAVVIAVWLLLAGLTAWLVVKASAH